MDFIYKVIAVIFFYCNFVAALIQPNSSVVVAKLYPDIVNLPYSHLPYYFNGYPNEVDLCIKNETCKYHEYLRDSYPKYKDKLCWGYEKDCKRENAFSKMECSGKLPTYMKTKDEQIDLFYRKADFGNFFVSINYNQANNWLCIYRLC